MDNKSSKIVKSSKSSQIYICKCCDYTTSKKSNYTKHLKTKKHISKSLSKSYPTKMDNKKVANRYFCACGKSYQFMSGLSKHKKRCSKIMVTVVGNNLKKGTTLFSNLKKGTTLFEDSLNEKEQLEKNENENENEEILSLKEEIKDLKSFMKDMVTCQKSLTENQKDFAKSQQNLTEGQKHLTESIKSNNDTIFALAKENMKSNNKLVEVLSNNTGQTVYNNCNNQNNMTINVFLNEHCKDALNLTDFVQNIKVTLEDLQYTKDNGFVNGVTNIITKQLQDLKPTQRPIHCSDKKRLQFYVKDDDKWEKDVDNKKLDDAVRDVKLKLPKSLTEWEKMNPSYKKDPKLMDEWMNIMAGITEGDIGNTLKEKLALKRKIATYIELKEAMATKKE